MEDEEKKVLITIKLDQSLYQAARECAAATGVSVSFVVREALREWVEKEKKDVNTGRIE